MNTKICHGCGSEFHRPTQKSGRLLSVTIWKRTKYCSRECSDACPERRALLKQMAIERGYGKWMVGKKLSAETRKKIALANINHGRSGWTLSDETRQRMAVAKAGDKSPLWRGGLTKANALFRTQKPYRDWRRAVFERDNYTCVACGAHGVRLHADHIMPFALFPEKRLNTSNGRTLCVPCHKKTPTYLKSGKKLVEASYPGVTITEIARAA